MTANSFLGILCLTDTLCRKEGVAMDTAAIVVLGAVFLLILALTFLVRLNEFREELDYINIELARCSRSARKHWKREKRRLWLWFLLGIPKE